MSDLRIADLPRGLIIMATEDDLTIPQIERLYYAAERMACSSPVESDEWRGLWSILIDTEIESEEDYE